jgi:carbon storage regulator
VTAEPVTAIADAKAKAKATRAMLILTRNIEQGIVISGNIFIRILGVEHDRVKIGISAPSDVKVLRQELWHEGEENQRLEVKDRTDNSNGTVDTGPPGAPA